MKKLILFSVLLLAGCAGTPLFDVKEDAAKERAALRIVVSHYKGGQYSCEDFAILVEMLEISEESDSTLEHTYK